MTSTSRLSKNLDATSLCKCDKCDFTGSSKAVREHNDEVHLTTINAWNPITRVKDIKIIRQDGGEKPWICPAPCGVAFSHRSKLAHHLEKHQPAPVDSGRPKRAVSETSGGSSQFRRQNHANLPDTLAVPVDSGRSLRSANAVSDKPVKVPAASSQSKVQKSTNESDALDALTADMARINLDMQPNLDAVSHHAWMYEDIQNFDNPCMKWLEQHGLFIVMPWKFLVCTGTGEHCESAVAVNFITSHFKTNHKGSLSCPGYVTQFLKKLGIAFTYEDMIIPHGIIAPLSLLKFDIEKFGYQCLHPDCEFAGKYVLPGEGSGREKMSKHFSNNHPVKHWDRFIQKCHFQKLHYNKYEGASGKTLFRVYPVLQDVDEEDDFAILYQEIMAQKKSVPERPPYRQPITPAEVTPWLDRTGWHKLLIGCDAQRLKLLVTVPEDENNPLSLLNDFVFQYLKEAASKVDRLGSVLRRWINTDNEHAIDVLEFLQPYDALVQRYSLSWSRLIYMLIQTVCHEAEPGFPVPMSKEVRKGIEQLNIKMQRKSKKITYAEAYDCLHKVFFALISTYHECLPTDKNACPFMRFLVLDCLRLDNNGVRLLDAKGASPRFAPLQMGFRLIVIEEGVTLSLKEAQKIADIFSAMRPLISDNSMNAWGNLQSTFSIAKFIGARTQSKPATMWSDDGERLTLMTGQSSVCLAMAEMRALLHTLVQEATTVLHEKVLLGGCMNLWQQLEDKLANFSDNLRTETVGYSFLTDPDNDLWPMEEYTLLKIFVRIKPAVFHIKNRHAGVITDEIVAKSKITWRVPRIQKWFQDIAELLKLIVTLCSFLYGPPGRATELAASLLENASTRTRSVVLMDHLLTFLGLYNKTSRAHAQDKLIARSVPRELSVIIIFYLVYVRPLEIYWAPIAYPNKSQTDLSVYSSYFWVSLAKEMTPTDISKAQRFYTFRGLGFEIGVRDWRQIAIAILRYHLRIHKIKGMDLDDLFEALHTGHSVSISEANYAIAESLQDSSAMMREFLDACARWHTFWGFKGNNVKIPVEPTEDNDGSVLQNIQQLLIQLGKNMTSLESTVNMRMDKIESRMDSMEMSLKDIH